MWEKVKWKVDTPVARTKCTWVPNCSPI